MAKSFITYIFIFVLFTTAKAYGEGIIVSPVGKNNVITKPGKICSVVYKISNKTVQNIELSPQLILPNKWQPVISVQPFELKAKEQKTSLLSFKVPDFTPAGKYDLTFKVSTDDGGYNASFDFSVEVTEEIRISMELIESSKHVAAGDEATAQFLVTNESNLTQTITLEPVNGIVQGSNKLKLGAGSSQIVNVSALLSKDFTSVSNKSIRLKAVVDGHNDIFVNKFYTFRVIPVKEKENDLYFRFPVEVGVRYLMRNNKGENVSGFQGQIIGDGFLDLKKTKRLSFMARGPNQFNMSVLGVYDQYYAAYQQKEFMFFLGDKTYRLSPLTEMSRYGRGAEGQINMGRFQVGGFYQQPRFYPYLKDETAGYMNYNFYKDNSVGVSYLRKRYVEEKDDAHLVSVGVNLQPFENSLLEVELSGGKKGKNTGYGVYTNFVGNWRRVNLAAMFIYTSKYYPGYYTNSLFYSVNGNWRITRRLNLYAGIRQDYQNAARDTLFGAAPYNQGYNAGLGYYLKKDMDIRFYYERRERMDRALKPKYHYRENLFKLYFTHRIKKFGYQFNGEIGKNENLLLPVDFRTSVSYRATVDLNYDITRWLYVSSFVSFMSNNYYTVERTNNWIYGASISAIINHNMRMDVWFQNDYELEEYYRNRSLFNANFQWMITKNHEINAMANYALLQKELDATDYSVSVSYIWHFGVPLKKTGEAGMINGKISNVTSENFKPVILHINGRSVYTDENGNFTIKNLKPGTYYLLLDKSTLDIHQIPDIPEPIKVDVKANEETFVTFGLTKAARVEGRIEINNKGNSLKILDDAGQPGHVILEIKNEKESLKIISDDDGTFRFSDIRPGKWILKVYKNGLSSKYKLEKSQFDLDLKPGEHVTIPVRLIKREKKIIFVSEHIELSENIHTKQDN